ncbi:shieldin complex subunit 1 isoform X3 [Cervus elaphus]|uniref:shieldin complex subunit 1 isoform X3 n=1 Tax=Cervus elaphus TaxID=9860 RepID=UPI001CC30645|nr:shieldin complex subunit 1 isoform X3 [Cervus elaphus]
MATQETTPGSQTEESNALDLPSAYDIRDYVLQRPRQETNSEAFSSEEACSIPCSSDVDPGFLAAPPLRKFTSALWKSRKVMEAGVLPPTGGNHLFA